MLFGLLAGLIAAIAGIFIALYALGFFNYLGGKKSSPNAVTKEILVQRIMDLNDPTKPYRIIKGENSDLLAEWKVVDATWYGIFNKNGLKEAYRANLLLDEGKHSVRCFEDLGTISWSAGARGLTPAINYQKSSFGGRILYKREYAVGYGIRSINPPEAGKVYQYKFVIDEIRDPIIQAVKESGWEWVPVIARRHATFQNPANAITSQLETKAFCPKCGSKLPQGAGFCPKCGGKTT